MTSSSPIAKPHSHHHHQQRVATLIIAILALTLALFTPLRTFLPKILPKSSSSTFRAMLSGSSSPTLPSLKITKRSWSARGKADHGWLYSFHTFSFADYYDQNFSSFGPLRVINEDRVKPSTGFGTHGHAEFLIFSYIVSGTLEHKDSLGNLENLTRGEVQFTSAGTGIRHSEYNRDRRDEVHFVQIWAKPDKKGLAPHYETKKFPDEMKTDKLLRIMEYTERMGAYNKCAATETPIALQADLSMDASILAPGKRVVHQLVAEGERKVYVQVVMSGREQPGEEGARIRIGDVEVGEGDGVFVEGARGPGKVEVESVGGREAEFLLFDLGVEDA